MRQRDRIGGKIKHKHYHSMIRLILALFASLTIIAAQGPSQPNATSAPISPILPRGFDFALPLFDPNSAWNQTATQADVLTESDQQILVTYRVLRGTTRRTKSAKIVFT